MNTNMLPIESQMSPAWFDFLIVLGALALVAFITFVWAVFVRKKKTPYRRQRRHHAAHPEQFQKDAHEIRPQAQTRRKHGERRPLNPTLAEIGGLPPIRDEEKSSGPTPPALQS